MKSFNEYMTELGSSKIRNLKKNGSYIFVYDSKDKVPIFESLKNNGRVIFYSDGKPPVIDASVDGIKKEEKYLFHGDSSVHWNIVQAKLSKNKQRDLKDWPVGLGEPFNRKIDASFNKNDFSIFLTRDRLGVKILDRISAYRAKSILANGSFVGIETVLSL